MFMCFSRWTAKYTAADCKAVSSPSPSTTRVHHTISGKRTKREENLFAHMPNECVNEDTHVWFRTLNLHIWFCKVYTSTVLLLPTFVLHTLPNRLLNVEYGMRDNLMNGVLNSLIFQILLDCFFFNFVYSFFNREFSSNNLILKSARKVNWKHVYPVHSLLLLVKFCICKNKQREIANERKWMQYSSQPHTTHRLRNHSSLFSLIFDACHIIFIIRTIHVDGRSRKQTSNKN